MSHNKSHIVFICGSALRGQPDHKNLAGAEFLGVARSAPNYRIHAVKDGWHPGIYEVDENGVAIPGELYGLTSDRYQFLVSTEPPNMFPADILLDDGRTVTAMLYPQHLIVENDWPDISDQGGWIAFKEQSAAID